ncbi:tyrosine-type recombinase/integrase [Massilia sp. PWRC2]|uniref:tyrosine-type recombinase/integrase n=1 Tax=Massilia sp. PWRC2 TaxID=2804626 RepID=UPI003CF7FCB0
MTGTASTLKNGSCKQRKTFCIVLRWIFSSHWRDAHRRRQGAARPRAIRAIERRGSLEVAKRMAADCARVFNYAVRSGLAERNPAALLGEVLEVREKSHFAALSPDQLPGFLRALHGNEACMGMPTRVAMRLMLMVFVRTSELIETPWSEIDLDKGGVDYSLDTHENGPAQGEAGQDRPSRLPVAASGFVVARAASADRGRHVPVSEHA